MGAAEGPGPGRAVRVRWGPGAGAASPAAVTAEPHPRGPPSGVLGSTSFIICLGFVFFFCPPSFFFFVFFFNECIFARNALDVRIVNMHIFMSQACSGEAIFPPSNDTSFMVPFLSF